MNVFNKNSFWGLVQHLARMHNALNEAVQGKAWNEQEKEYTEVPEYRKVQKVPTNVREWRALRKAADSPYAILWPLSMSTAVKTVCDIAVFLLKWWQESENGCAKWQPRCSFKDHRDILVEVFILWTLEHLPDLRTDLQGICKLWDSYEAEFQDLRVDRSGCSKLHRAVYDGRLDEVKLYILNEHAVAWKNKLGWNSLTLLEKLGDESEREKIYGDSAPFQWKPPILYSDTDESHWWSWASDDVVAPRENFDSEKWAPFREHFSEMQTLLKNALEGKPDFVIQLKQEASCSSATKLTADRLAKITGTSSDLLDKGMEASNRRVPDLHNGEEDTISCYYSTYCSSLLDGSYKSLSTEIAPSGSLDRDTEVSMEEPSGLFPTRPDREKRLQQYIRDIVELEHEFEYRNKVFFRIAFLCIPEGDYVGWEKSVDQTLLLDDSEQQEALLSRCKINTPSSPMGMSDQESWKMDSRYQFLKWSRNKITQIDDWGNEKAIEFLRSWGKEKFQKECSTEDRVYKYLFADYICSRFPKSVQHFRSALNKFESWVVDWRCGWTKLHSAVYFVNTDALDDMLRQGSIDADLLHWKDAGEQTSYNQATGEFEFTEGMTALEMGKREYANDQKWTDWQDDHLKLKEMLDKLEKAMQENPVRQLAVIPSLAATSPLV
jgi:hypothetical protein